MLVTELLTNIGAHDADKPAAAEAIFNKTRTAIAKASDGEQVPSVSSSLLEDVSFAATDKAGG